MKICAEILETLGRQSGRFSLALCTLYKLKSLLSFGDIPRALCSESKYIILYSRVYIYI